MGARQPAPVVPKKIDDIDILAKAIARKNDTIPKAVHEYMMR